MDEDTKQRLIAEHDALWVKLSALSAALASADAEQRLGGHYRLLMIQRDIMRAYHEVLITRLRLL